MFALPEKAMILAAGKGTRMKKLTEELPKPLIPVGGFPLIDYALQRLVDVGVNYCVVNVCHHGEKMIEHLLPKLEPAIAFSEEEVEPLETGGGVKKALPLLGYEPFYVTNSDPIWTEEGEKPSLLRMAEAFEPELMDVMLLLVPIEKVYGHDGFGDYFIENGKPRRRKPEEPNAPYVYAGAQILTQNAFENTPEGKFSLVKVYDEAEKKGRLAAIVHEGYWFHVGTPEALALAEKTLFSGNN